MTEQPRPTNPKLQAAVDLIYRVLPTHADQFVVEIIPPDGDRDIFEIESQEDKIVLRGNNGVSVASALNRYLKDYPKCQFSWHGDQLALPDVLPSVPTKLRVECLHKYRANYNYCTLSYTASWWDWERWEREIDFLAMNGINMPLGVIGLEAVWYHALLKIGLTDTETREFLVGPAYFAWQWMTNIQSHGGPLPKEWIDKQLILGRQILNRQRSLGMTPIQQGFTGFVPRIFKDKFPEANIVREHRWCDFDGTAQLDPLDPLFKTFGKIFLETQIELMGTSHIYAADPFHEGSPPRPGREYLVKVGEAINELITGVDPKATIVMQAWSIREPICTAFPKENLIVLDLSGYRDNFWGYRYVKGQLHNFGGRINMHGDLADVATNRFAKMAKQNKECVGMGLFMEAIEQNPVFYNMVYDMIWRDAPVDAAAWVSGYAKRRYGEKTANTQAAWSILLKRGPYVRGTSGVELSSIITARPALVPKKSGPNAGFKIPYDPKDLVEAWRLLLADAERLKGNAGYQFDVADVGRQVMSNLGQELHRNVEYAFLAKDRAAFKEATDAFINLLRDVDTLLAPIPTHNFGKWVYDARSHSDDEATQNLYELNASMLVTIWGPQEKPLIFDYSWREWSGLIKHYYIPRWEKFYDYLGERLANDEEYKDPKSQTHGRESLRANNFYSELTNWELEWVTKQRELPAVSTENPVELAQKMYAKYKPLIEKTYTTEHLGRLQKKRAEIKERNAFWRWLVTPPYPYDTKKSIAEQINPPENGEMPKGCKRIASLVDEVVDLRTLITGRSNVCAYAQTNLISTKAGSCRLGFNSDDGIAIWLNGKKIHEADVYRGVSHAIEYVDVLLKEGDNTLLVKVTQGGGGWAMRVTADADLQLVNADMQLRTEYP